MRYSLALTVLSCLVTPGAALADDADLLPGWRMAEGDKDPAGWRLEGGQGKRVDREVLEVRGEGKDSSYWRSDALAFEPGKLYHFQMRARRPSGSGCVISGPNFANRDHGRLGSDWQEVGHFFRVPDGTERGYVRLGQWHATGTVQFQWASLVPALPVNRQIGDLILGEGESICDGRYAFLGTFDYAGSNYHRTLDRATAGFNSDRWCFGAGDEVTYRFEVPGHKLLSGKASFHVNHHTRGQCVAEVSRDGKTWQRLGVQSGLGTCEVEAPAELVPAETLLLRLSAPEPGSSFQVNRVEFEAKLDGSPPDATGQTLFASLHSTDPGVAVQRMTFQRQRASTELSLLATVGSRSPAAGRTTWSYGAARVTMGNPIVHAMAAAKEVVVEDGRSTTLPMDVRVAWPGEHTVYLFIASSYASEVPGEIAGGRIDMTVRLSIPEFYRSDYGELLSGADAKTAVWWSDATHKIPRSRALPEDRAEAAQMSAARHDYEAVQVVVRPEETLKGLTAAASDLKSADGATIAAEHVKILRVYYHFVHHPTDSTGVRDWWPDALPPLDEPIDVEAGHNQPLWVLVHVPKDAKPGDYTGRVTLTAEGWSVDVPLELHVWNFALPERNHLETAFGLSTGNIFRYHNLKTDEDRRKVLDMYLACFAEHRISPYDPTPLDRIGVKWLPEADPPRAELDFSAFDPEMARVVDKYHFTSIRLSVHGMGGGTFHSRVEPRIGNFGEETPQYQAMFSSYVKQLQDHLRDKGWLDMAYVYWFDEPAPKDYEFVANGMRRLKKFAPGLRRMITEEPGSEFDAPIDIWCPVSFNYNHDEAEKKRAGGAVFWWYVCCGPKAPYCTLFIDHPATELRIWHWQTWQRNIVGTLVWQSTYWTSSAAYPDEPQNPYEDPMGYVSGYSTPKGVKRYWGNGDGRFIYPPLAAAVPGKSGGKPVLEPPVSSIRWEMIREGVEDYEMLYLFRELIEKHRRKLSPEDLRRYQILLEVPPEITFDMTSFTTDPEPIYAHRAAIAAAIERLAKTPPSPSGRGPG